MRYDILASGSSGNSILVSSERVNILIDGGLNFKHLENKLKKRGVSPGSLSAIFVTHEHGDHIKGVRGMASRYQIPVFATNGTWRSLAGQVQEDLRNEVSAGKTVGIKDIHVTPFSVLHDAFEPVGYSITIGSKKLSITLDLGAVTDDLLQAIQYSDYYIFEANHDEDMLMAGEYPESLKERIKGKMGHISNRDAGQALRKVLQGFGERVHLVHLSGENNIPELARMTVGKILESDGFKLGKDVHLYVDAV